MAASARVIALTGLADENTSPKLAEDYVGKLVARQIDARFVGIEGASHNSALVAPEVMTAIGSLLP